MGNNAGLTEEERQRIIEALAEHEVRQQDANPIRAVKDYSKRSNWNVQPPDRENNLSVIPVSNIEEQIPNWLISEYIPRYQITTMAGDGGSGKTTIWCAIAAAVSNGTLPFLLKGDEGADIELQPGKVMIFSSEDSLEYTLVRRLRKNGANLNNIVSIPISDERFEKIKFDSEFLRDLLEEHRPTLCVFDPIQAFVPPNIKMGDRNAMRNCMSPLIGYGTNFGVTFLIAMHSNKQSGVWGRKRMADSSDVWDISRSVMMVGETNQDGIRYISHEKSNLGRTAPTVLFSIEDEVICWKGYTDKKDRDYVTEHDVAVRAKPQRDEAKEFILDFLKDGEKEVSELGEMAKACGISENALKNAKADLKKEGKIKVWSIGFKKDERKFLIKLLEGQPLTDS